MHVSEKTSRGGGKTLSGSQHRRREVHLAELQLQSNQKHLLNSVVKSGHIQVGNITNSKLQFVSLSKLFHPNPCHNFLGAQEGIIYRPINSKFILVHLEKLRSPQKQKNIIDYESYMISGYSVAGKGNLHFTVEPQFLCRDKP